MLRDVTQSGCGFQRARRPEQVRERRGMILDAALRMLRERPVADISLRELSSRVGLAKSNVLRYFDSREAIFLELLDREWQSWLAELDESLGEPAEPARTLGEPAEPAGTLGERGAVRAGGGGFRGEIELARTIAASVVRRPLLCELIAAMAGVLERNIGLDTARTFKKRALANTARLAELVGQRVAVLPPEASMHFAGATFVMVAGLWPYATPTEAVATAIAELDLPAAGRLFADGLAEGLVNQLVGLVARHTTTA
jgi:AcrR family transcriptional regulator